MLRSVLLTLLVVFGTTSLTGCKLLRRLAQRTGDDSAAAQPVASEPEEGPSEEERKDAALSNKLEGHISCLNSASQDALGAKRSYLSRIDETAGPTGKETGVWVRQLDPTPCFQALDKAKNLQPSLPEIDQAAIAYRTALEALAPLVRSAHEYYDRKDFKDDQWAKGKQMHAPLLAAFAKFERAHDTYDQKVTTLNEQLAARRLARLEKDQANRLPYLIEKSVHEAKRLIRVASVDDLASLDQAALGAALEAYEKALAELDQHARANTEQASKVIMFSIFLSASNDYLKAAKELLRRKRDNQDFAAEHGNPQHIDGHPAQVIYRYNALIGRSNGLRFRN